MQNIYTYIAIIGFSLSAFALGYQVGHRDGYEAGKRAGMFRARSEMARK